MQRDDAAAFIEALEDDVAAVLRHGGAHAGLDQLLDLGHHLAVVIGGTSAEISAQAGNIYTGLWYAIIVALMTVVIGAIFVPGGTHKKDIFADSNQ